VAKWPNAAVCKTAIHRFDSGRRLHISRTKWPIAARRRAGRAKPVAFVVGLVALAGLTYYILVWEPAPILNNTTISECGPGKSPSTHLCYDPSLHS
jgi:hypothetical protein